jgi:GNAT superfamily N-acetyltransferase
MLTIVPAKPTDVEDISLFAQAAYDAIMPDARQRERFLERVYAPASLLRTIHNSGLALVVARLNTRLVGLAQAGSPLLEECTDGKELHRLLVLPAHIRHGIGSQMLERLITHYKTDQRVRQFFAYVPQADAARQQFMRKNGFQHHPAEDRDGEAYFVRQL